MFQERAAGELFVRIVGGGKPNYSQEISDITPGSTVGLKTDEGDVVTVKVTKNEAGNFTGSIFNIHPDPPQSNRLADLGGDAEVMFSEKHLKFVFLLPEQSSE